MNCSNGKIVFFLFILKVLVVFIILWVGVYGGIFMLFFVLGMVGAVFFGMILGGDS